MKKQMNLKQKVNSILLRISIWTPFIFCLCICLILIAGERMLKYGCNETQALKFTITNLLHWIPMCFLLIGFVLWEMNKIITNLSQQLEEIKEKVGKDKNSGQKNQTAENDGRK